MLVWNRKKKRDNIIIESNTIFFFYISMFIKILLDLSFFFFGAFRVFFLGGGLSHNIDGRALRVHFNPV